MKTRKKQTERRELFNLFATLGIYLTKYRLIQAQTALAGDHSPRSLKKYIKSNPILLTYTNKSLGHYNNDGMNAYLAPLRRAVVSENIVSGNVMEHNSIYQGAQYVGVKGGSGNIHSAIRSCQVAYGHVWKYLNK